MPTSFLLTFYAFGIILRMLEKEGYYEQRRSDKLYRQFKKIRF